MIDTMVYNVEFPDGTIRKYGETVIVYNMYSQVDSEVFPHSILFVILDFATDITDVHKGGQYIITKSANVVCKK